MNFDSLQEEYLRDAENARKINELTQQPGWKILEETFQIIMDDLDRIENAKTYEEFLANKKSKEMLKRFFARIQSIVERGREGQKLLDDYGEQKTDSV